METMTPPPFCEPPAMRPQRKFSDSISFKILFIALLTLVLLIPNLIIYNAVDDREDRRLQAIDEIGQQWSRQQSLAGPQLVIPYRTHSRKDSIGYVTILPASLNVTADLQSQFLRRGIFEDLVYTGAIEMTGEFDLTSLLPTNIAIADLITDNAAITVDITDLRGIEKLSDIHLGDNDYEFSGCHDEDVFYFDGEVAGAYLSANVNLDSLTGKKAVPYSLSMSLRGSHSLSVAPVGKSTSIIITGDCDTPSFNGMSLPSDREITDKDFRAEWNISAINRDYPQVYTTDNSEAISNSKISVNLLMPVDRYQKTERAIKYAVLVIILTFIGVLFAETMMRHKIYVFQYLLIGLALILFYSLLLALSEHMTFGLSYLIAAIMTITLVGGYMTGVLRNTRVGSVIALLLAVIYGYIFILLNLETYALLAGSIGLFIALAAIMYASLKMDWKTAA